MKSESRSSAVLKLHTGLGPDAVVLEKATGMEAMSEMFHFQLHLVAHDAFPFDKLLNQWATLCFELPNGTKHAVNGMICKLGKHRSPRLLGTPNRYEAELVPALWRLTKRVRSRIFQDKRVSEILTDILVEEWQLDVKALIAKDDHPRNYCVQYGESDFDFVSRLMEEEGIAYHFEHQCDDKDHAKDKHTLVLTDKPLLQSTLEPQVTVKYQEVLGGSLDEGRIWEWERTQEVTAGSYTVEDYHFEVPDHCLSANEDIPDSVRVGKTEQVLRFKHTVNDQETLEVYEFPGGFSHRFDVIDANGNERKPPSRPGTKNDEEKNKNAEIEALTAQSARLARLRAQEAAAWSLRCGGAGDCAHFFPGLRFQLEACGEEDGRYLLTRVEHDVHMEGDLASGGAERRLTYRNHFRCLPVSLPFRPRRQRIKPRVQGLQTATVVGSHDQPLFIDRYGRIKVRFRWDHEAAPGASSSCWVRVAQPWAGPRYGAFFWPRPGHEVVVGFEYGDPDRPLIIGSVYNDKNMPPYTLPEKRMLSGIKSCIENEDPITRFNAIVIHDTPDAAYVQVHSERSELMHSESTSFRFTKQQINIRGSVKK